MDIDQLKVFLNSMYSIPKKSCYTIFGIHHARVRFSNGSTLTMIDLTKVVDEFQNKPTYYEYISKSNENEESERKFNKISVNWTTGKDILINYTQI